MRSFAETTQRDRFQNLDAKVVYLRASKLKQTKRKTTSGEQTVLLGGLFEPKFLRSFRKKILRFEHEFGNSQGSGHYAKSLKQKSECTTTSETVPRGAMNNLRE